MKPALILLLLAAAPALAQETYDPSLDPKRYDGCVRAIPTDAQKAEEFAIQWQALGGGLPARHCQALAQLQQGRNAAAAVTLSKAAQAAEAQKSPMAADFWGQAGNAALLAGDAKGAVTYFSSGIVAARIAQGLGVCARDVPAAIIQSLNAARLPIHCPYGPDALCDFVLHDKKRRGDEITWVLPERLGQCRLCTLPVTHLPDLLRTGLTA